MESHEFVYIIAKDVKSGRVFTMIDNRPNMEPEPYDPNKSSGMFSSLFKT